MERYRPSQSLGQNFPAMHLVRSSWFVRTLSRFLFLLLVLLALAAIFLPWQQTATCEGEVVARLPNLRRQEVQAQAKGVISWMKPDLFEGAMVKEGEVIMILETLAKDQLDLTRSQLRALEDNLRIADEILRNNQQQIETEKVNLDRFLKSIENDIEAKIAKWKQAKAAVEAQTRVHNQAMRELQAAEKLKGEVISMIEYNQAVNKEAEEEAQLLKEEEAEVEAYQELSSKKNYLASKESEVATKILDLYAKVEKARSEVAKSTKDRDELKVKLGELERLRITSPCTGRIQSIFLQIGSKNVKEGDRLFEVIPDTSDLAVEFVVRGIDLPLIQGRQDHARAVPSAAPQSGARGSKVRIQFDGWPAIQFVGWPSVAVGTFGGEVIAVNPADDGQGNFKIIVGPDPDDPKYPNSWPDRRYLRQGVKANGWVILNTVPLGFELWRQLNGIPPSRNDKDKKDDNSKSTKLPKFK